MDRDIIKKYSNGEVTIVWEPKKCIHVGLCAQGLPEVFHPKDRPWVTPENATTEQITNQIDQCPSGALTYYMNNDKNQNPENAAETTIVVKENGPLLVKGTIEVQNIDGTTEEKSNTTAFCRCGASENKPYCDGSHNKVGFKG